MSTELIDAAPAASSRGSADRPPATNGPLGAPPKPPRVPKRMPRSMQPLAPLTPMQVLSRSILTVIAALLFAFAANLMVLSHLQHLVSQQQLTDSYRAQLAAGTAPVSEGAFDKTLLPDGAPVAIIDIPSIGVHEVVVEGTSSAVTKSGPGHRRDTVLPGQAGLSIVMGRAASFGGPFSRIQELAPGDTFTVLTGQGLQMFSVIGVRYAGDPAPPAMAAGQSRMILETARGAAYIPMGTARVDAQLVSTVVPAGQRQSAFATLPPQDKEMATDTSTVWALVFALQFFVVAEIAAVWAYRKIGAQKMWVVFVPVMFLAGLLVADQVTRLLPNLL
ncbi:sortase [Herbiconiux sp. 11R-BC]|uniref:sortase n=1 Tax=Herbiconiux sp. 11R-BC TaxID=3111637 RepID=UPI003BFD0459